MNRVVSRLLMFVSLMQFTLGTTSAALMPRTNFVIVLCDDLGYGDIGCFGHPHIKTPQLDKLAGEGLRLTDCYAAAPVCSPSRSGLLTGRIPNRLGVYDWIPEKSPMHLMQREITISRLLKDAVKAGELAGVRVGNRLSLPVAALNAWIDARRVGRRAP